MLLYFNRTYVVLLTVLSIVIFAYKDWKFPYPENYLGVEITILAFYFLEEMSRLLIGSSANKTENPKTMALFGVCGIGALMLNVYFMSWQTYVLKVDVISNAIAVAIIALEILHSIFYVLAFMVVDDVLKNDEGGTLR
eukprot:CAMPEP_0184481860 /NCGR_PEP_ID=MMETSP0113_2-20130426/3448_1 /TAXON_ID=91329 /ORGANISM="Norrisiella sphaerica, Strain BC52" /LENGTH=137 /DNA_ID=CAMNT_0026861271 /DNA_START=125 /DNA_END=538 /DNA_ORIENTATION=+